jgi:hypothetical protein
MSAVLAEPKAIDARRKAYAFERSLGLPQAEACRRAGGNVDNGHATKWERSKDVQAWIVYFKSLGPQDEEILAAKRERYEQALTSIAVGDGKEFPGEPAPLDWPHRLNALAQLRDMNGMRAPRRSELSGPDGGPVQVEDMTKYTDEELAQLKTIQRSVDARHSVSGPDRG